MDTCLKHPIGQHTPDTIKTLTYLPARLVGSFQKNNVPLTYGKTLSIDSPTLRKKKKLRAFNRKNNSHLIILHLKFEMH